MQMPLLRQSIMMQGLYGEWRLILDLSIPLGASISGGSDLQPCPLHYPTVDEAFARILQFPPGALMAKVDIGHAYTIKFQCMQMITIY